MWLKLFIELTLSREMARMTDILDMKEQNVTE